MKIAIIGTGNVGGALATKWAKAGHEINLGTENTDDFKGRHLLNNPNIKVYPVKEAVAQSEVILLAVPATVAIDVAKSLGSTRGKIIVDAMNIINGRGPQGYTSTTQAVLDNVETTELVKCFNSTGFNNMQNPVYGATPVDMFMAGDSVKGKETAHQLALDAGFAACYDIGGNQNFELLEKFAFFWINLAMMQGHGRDIAFKLLKR